MKLLKCLSIFVCTVGLVHYSMAVTVGPRPPPDQPSTQTVQSTKSVPSRFDIPAMSVAVPVLDPNIDESSDDLASEGIWPELRKVEAIRAATKIRDALIGINQFEAVAVFPDASASAEFYLLGKLEKSTGEELAIRWDFVDATGKEWIRNRLTSHRVPLGWHERFGGPGIDAHEPLYEEIAQDVWKLVKRQASDHNNKRRAKRGNASTMSDLDQIVAVRKLVFAQYLAPSLYRDTIKEKDSRFTISYLPAESSADWQRILSLQARDSSFANLMDRYYSTFVTRMEPAYEEWQRDIFPVAREVRLTRRRATIEKVVGTVATVAAVVAAVDADTTGARDTALAAGAVIGGGLLFKGFLDSTKAKREMFIFNEMAESYNTTFQPMRVEIEGKTVTLHGTATEQFHQWRSLMRDVFEKEQVDSDAVQIVE